MHPLNQPTNHRVIQRAINSSIDPSKPLNSSNLCTQSPYSQPLKNLIIHPSTKLSNYSVIHPSAINLCIHLTTQSAIHPFIQRGIISSNDPTNHLYSGNLCTHRPPKHHIIHPKLSIQSVILPSGIDLSIHLTDQPSIHPFIHPNLIIHPNLFF